MTQTLDAPAKSGSGSGSNLPARTSARFEPLAPIGSAGALKSLLESQSRGIATAMPKHVTPERLIKTMLVAANRIPDLLKCTQASILETINRAAELGLDLSGTLGEAYPVPFNNKVKTEQGERWVMQCQLIIGYRGMEKLAWQSGEVESIDAEVVCENDQFVFKKGTTVLVEWAPPLKLGQERGKVIGVYACVSLKSGGKLARFLTREDVEKIRNSAKSKDSPAWRNWWDEMARKCALKRTLKDAPLSTEKFVAALEHDNDDYQLPDVLEVSRVEHSRGTRTQQLSDELKGNGDEAATQTGRQEAGTALGTESPTGAPSDAEQQGQQQEDQGQGEQDDSQQEQTPFDQAWASGGKDDARKLITHRAKEINPSLGEKLIPKGIATYIEANGDRRSTWQKLYELVDADDFSFGLGTQKPKTPVD